ncbi:MAG TPA: PIG-L family deacetylase [Thermoanaerobaculaceae bacterium]|nr:PIG-L family deacetylase [Thermoanaerobaculaceae bacterium]
MIQTLALTPGDRLLVLAPHPDDESVATGGLLQHAVAVGSKVCVVFFTEGDNNPWAQRALELRWRIGASDRARFATRRRAEVEQALAQLGVPLADTRFLGFPDQGAADLLLHANDLARGAIADALDELRPTVVVMPSLLDLHPDHSALAVMMTLAMRRLDDRLPVRKVVRFLVHNPQLRSRRHEGSLVLPLSEAQRARKRAAIACHKSQLVLRGSWLLSFASDEERYYLAESPSGLEQHPVAEARFDERSLTVSVASRTHLRSFGPRTLCLAGAGEPPVRLVVGLPASGGHTPVREPRTGRVLGEASFDGAGGTGTLTMPAGLAGTGGPLFAKVERRFGFFDEAGWKEIARPGVR